MYLPADRTARSRDAEPRPAPPERLPGGLRYVHPDTLPGLTRVLRGKHFKFRTPDGQWVTDEEEIARIRKLAIPPAYTNVWICPLPEGHLQATGLDARGRRQYRYHPEWRQQRDEAKFERMQAFGRALPRIRARVARDLRPGAASPRSRARWCWRPSSGSWTRPSCAWATRSTRPPTAPTASPRCATGMRACAAAGSPCAFAARAAWSSRRPWTTRAWPAWCAGASSCRGRSCSSTRTKTAHGTPWAPAT